MPRALDIGTYGEINVLRLPDGKFKARARFRDYDGRTRIVARTNTTEARAKTDLKRALASRRGAGGTEVNANTRLSELADLWLEQDHGWSTGTQTTYTSLTNARVKPALGSVRLSECTPATIGRALDAIKATHPSAAKSTRTCLSGMFALAIAHGALQFNPVRDAPSKISVPRKRPKALTVVEQEQFCDWLRTDAWVVDHDLPDLVDFMLGTGCRIGEAFAARHATNIDGEPLIDLDSGTWEINAIVVRLKGQGLHVQERTKSDAGWRRIALPADIVDLVIRRRGELRPGLRGAVFGSPRARALRDVSNTIADLRETLVRYRAATGVDLSWVTSHTFRKTVATRMEAAGCTAREVADHLGHSRPSMTQDYYFGRDVVIARAATILARPNHQ